MYYQLQDSPTLMLLHKRHAGILLSFFHQTFKAPNTPEVPEERLLAKWESFIEEEISQSEWDGEPPTNTAKFYAEEWAKNRWVARYFDERESSYMYRLTSYSEQALLFAQQHLSENRRTFVGTESNFSKIWHALTELTERTQTDPKLRERQLIEERDRIDAEIIELRRTGKPRTLDPTAVKSRVFDLLQMANRFLADFRSVEDSFRKQRDEIQNLYLEQERSRGDIVAAAIEAVELLKDSDEGRSFYGFQRLLRSSEEVDKLRDLIARSLELGRQYQIEVEPLRTLVSRLLEEQNRTQQTLSAITKQLHIVVEESFRKERRLLIDVVTNIKKHAHLRRANPPLEITTTCYLNPRMAGLMGVRFFEKRIRDQFDTTIVSQDGADESLNGFFRNIGPELRMKEIEGIIEEELKAQPQVSLSTLVRNHPLKYGPIDLLCYVFAAGRHAQHQFNDQIVEIALASDPVRTARTHEIIFHRPAHG